MEQQRRSLLSVSPFIGPLLTVLLLACGENPASQNKLGRIGGDSLSSEDPVTASHSANTGIASAPSATGVTFADAEADVNAVRAEMLAELEAVRARLNVGTTPAQQHRADTKRAAELAIGIERVDRTARLLDATEAGWPLGRDTAQDALADLQAWWRAHQPEATAQVEE